MDVTPLVRADAQIIQSYGGGVFRVSGQSYDTAIRVTSSHTHIWERAREKVFSDLTEDDFSSVIDDAENIDVVLLGCGENMAFLKPNLKANLKSNGIHIETMDTGAACRTYNVLMAEGRRIVALLMPC